MSLEEELAEVLLSEKELAEVLSEEGSAEVLSL